MRALQLIAGAMLAFVTIGGCEGGETPIPLGKADSLSAPVVAPSNSSVDQPRIVFLREEPLLAAGRDMVFYGFGEGYTEGIKAVDYEGKQDRIIYRIPEHPGSHTHIWSLTCSKDGQRVVFSAWEFLETGGSDTRCVKMIEGKALQVKTLFKGMSWGIAFMPGETAILYDDCNGLYIRDLTKPNAKPKLLIQNAFAPDVWYSE